MSYRKLIRSSTIPYHVTARSNNRDHFPVSLSDFWNILTETLLRTIELYGIKPHCLVLMPNHFHLLAFTPNENLGLAMNHWMREMAKSVNRNCDRQDHLWGGRYRRCLVDSEFYYANAYRYVLQNPVRANLVSRVEDWKYSAWMCSDAKLLAAFPSIAEPWGITRMQLSRLRAWVNHPIDPRLKPEIAKALTKGIYGQP